ncbi:hypothetical protein AB7M56_002666 [Bradyrhizobium elkanii]
MRVLCAVAVVVLLSAPAYAQMPNVNLMPEVKTKTQEEKEQDAVRDKAYKDSLSKIPDAKGSSDPWGVVRSDPPKAAAHPAKPKTKTGSSRAARKRRAAQPVTPIRDDLIRLPQTRILPPPPLYWGVVSWSGVAAWCLVRAISPAGWPSGESRTTAICARPSVCHAIRPA